MKILNALLFLFLVPFAFHSTATVILPADSKDLITLNSKPVPASLIKSKYSGRQETALELSSGKYRFEVRK